MSYSELDLINYRLERAKESLEEAKILAQAGHWNTVVNRLYYTCFYTIQAAFIKNKIKTTTHTGTKALFHKEFIKTKLLDKSHGKIFDLLFNNRHQADYEDFRQFTREEIEPLIQKTENFYFTFQNSIH